MAAEAESFCKSWVRNSGSLRLLVLVGESNCGKTHVARRVHNFCRCAGMKAFETGKWDKGGRVPGSTFVSWPEQTDQFKEGNYGVIQDLMDDDMVILDDVGAEHDPSKNSADKLCQVLSRRENKFTVVTTNIKMEDWPSKFDTRIADRLLRGSRIIALFGVPSYAMV